MSTSVSSPATGAGEVAGTAPGGLKSSYRLSLKRQSPSYDGTELGTRETWISTNKILNSSYCGRRTNSRNPNFDYDESKLLISLWGDPQVQKALITTHKKHPVIAELARKMREHGYNRSTEEINTRIKNLKCFYNRIKKDMAAGLINQTTWRHYADMDEIISRPVFGNRKKSDRDSLDEDGRSTQSLELELPPLPSDEPLPVKLELMSDDDDDDRDDDEPTEIRAEDLLTIDASFPEEMSAAASSSSSSSGVGGSGGIAKKTYPSTASRSNGRTNSDVGAGRSSEPTATTAAAAAATSVRKVRAGGNGGNADGGQDDDDDDDDDEDDDEEDDDDDDDDGSDFDVENEFNDGLDEILLKAQSKGNASGTGTKTITGNNSGKSSTDGTAASKGPATPSTSVAAAPPQQQQQGKISVVPTNLLLKTPSSLPTSSLSAPIQIFTKPTVSLAAAAGASTLKPPTMGIGTGAPTAGAPMKLLLVNTVGKDGTTKQILTPAGDMANLPKLMPTTTLKQATTGVSLSLASTSGTSPIVSIPTVNVPPNKVPTITGVHSLPKHIAIGRPPVPPGTERESSGFKTLLTQLVTIQRENLALNQERLALEKERLEFETKFGGSFVSMVQNMSTFFSNMLKHQRQDVVQSKQPVLPPKEVAPVTKQTTETKPVESKKSENNDSSSAAASESRSQETVSALGSKQPAAPVATTLTINSTSVAVESSVPSSAPVGKQPLPAPPALTPLVANASKPNADESVGTPLPKKRRMMTRNATQPATSTTDDALKTEVISDNDDH
ncbi:uncharacterized protein LOC125958128 [Anopheles darlingi]|uniref:uncharacterized protein LOC125958128 n=1 Tax=Anopheles darlingi TaxID=43151 RepID=UPI00210056DF|nr:uncharacterized protein LOC125958128 [Anopheles darlingi]